jgi:hypothetical protein
MHAQVTKKRKAKTTREANVPSFGEQVNRQMTSILTSWPGTEEHAFALVDKVALTDKAASKKGSDGGNASGAARLEKADEEYRNDALDLAKQIRTEKPHLSQKAVATEIGCRWKSERPCRDSMLVPLVSEWEREGKLPRRQAKQGSK